MAGAAGRHTRGLSTDLVASWLSKELARLAVLAALPPDGREGLCERCLSSDVIKLVFSMLVQVCGYKPSARLLASVTAYIDAVARIKQMST